MAFDWPMMPFDSETNKYDYGFDVPTGRIKETLTETIYPFTWVLTQDATGFKNPKNFATEETAHKLEAWAKKHFSSPEFQAKQLSAQSVYSSVPYFGEFQLEATANGKSESFNAGLLAFTLAKFGDAYTRNYFKAQLDIAGLYVIENEANVAVEPNTSAKAKPAPAKPLTDKEKAKVEGIMNQDNVPK